MQKTYEKTVASELDMHWRVLLAVLSPSSNATTIPIPDTANFQWERLFSLADRHLVAPLLYARLQQKGLAEHCPADFLQALAAIHTGNQERNAQHRQILLDAIAELNQAGITPTLLKGAHALCGLLPNHQERIISDIDLLVPPERVLEAKHILMTAGFYPENPQHLLDDTNCKSHHISPLFHPTLHGYVELHRRPNYSQCYPELVSLCFEPKTLNVGTIGNSTFYYQQPWQLLLYNQVHHYHSAIDLIQLDLRHLAEQAALLQYITDSKQLRTATTQVWENNPARADMQYYWLANLMNVALPFKISINRSIEKRAKLILDCVQGNSKALKTKSRIAKWAMLTYIVRNMLDATWLKQRIFNWQWYRSRPALLRNYLRSNTILR